MYSASEIWHINSLKSTLKQKLLSSSARALKLCMKKSCERISFVNLHQMNNRATPENQMIYKHALQLHKLYNSSLTNEVEWLMLNDLQVLTSRQTKFVIQKGNNTKVGLNALANRLHIINNKIPLSWLNLSVDTFKVKCKSLLL